jgi:hypothetical protein
MNENVCEYTFNSMPCTTMRHICSQEQQQFIYINEHNYARIHLISGSESEAVANIYNFFALCLMGVQQNQRAEIRKKLLQRGHVREA